MKIERAITVARDLVCLVIGAGGVAYQQVTLQVSWELLLVYVAFLAPPLGGSLLRLRSEAAARTNGSSSSSAPRSSPPDSSAPAPSASPGGGEP